jgi:ABC-type multidrug transport system ATPase subunit
MRITYVPCIGPSGAGKTTLLNILIGNAGGRVEGKVLINGRELRDVQRRFKKLQTLVPQDDTLLSSLTAREALTFAARLRLPFHWSAARKQKMVGRATLSSALFTPQGSHTTHHKPRRVLRLRSGK